jgi:hypothetical protein
MLLKFWVQYPRMFGAALMPLFVLVDAPPIRDALDPVT